MTPREIWRQDYGFCDFVRQIGRERNRRVR
jgi:hypothetical protein